MQTMASVSTFCLFLLIGSISASRPLPKILGGVNADIKDSPFVVSIRFNGRVFCGGSIITERHILTSAHCMDLFRQDLVTVHSGTSGSNKKGHVHKILSIHTHPEWGSSDEKRDFIADIAVLTLQNPIVFNQYQQKIHLPSHDVRLYDVGDLFGWGRTSYWQPIHPEQLQKLRVRLLTSDVCQRLVTFKITEKQLCTYGRSSSGACYGDNGGPLVSQGELVGIVSFMRKENCATNVPDVYTNVFAYKDFIESIINQTIF